MKNNFDAGFLSVINEIGKSRKQMIKTKKLNN